MNKFKDIPFPDATAVENDHEAMQYATALWPNAKAILEANAQHMWNWGVKEGRTMARDDANILQQYRGTDLASIAYSWAKDNGITDSVVAGLCDLARAGFIRGYTGYMEDNPLVCDCCGQPLPPKEG